MQTGLRWDLFCRVIDNHGDLGVCWRLARQLADSGDTVRLWVDQVDALAWMAPEPVPAVRVIDWSQPRAVQQAAAEAPPQVLVEAFGCEPAPELLIRFAQAPAVQQRAWINLEYLSAEPHVERLHGLPSPVFSGPGKGLTKHFFYPGFSAATGGLLREPDLMHRRAAFDRAAWLHAHHIPWHPGERLVSLFCYEPPALASLLAQLAAGPQPTRLLVTAGRATEAVKAAFLSKIPLQRPSSGHSLLSISYLPPLSQLDFDHLLWACDLNFVRGEDSLVRALWAGAALVWHIYPQDDDAHHAKLQAWLNWLDAPRSLRQFHQTWNGLSSATPVAQTLDPFSQLDPWRATVQSARARLLAQDDLASQLRRFAQG